jgi:ParB family chromosome partitioning protein
LGRGLEALLGNPIQTTGEAPRAWSPAIAGAVPGASDGLVKLNVYEIDANPFQPRREFDESEIAALCESLKEHGLIQPIVVRRAGERYQLIAGERRLRAAIKAGWSEVPAQLKQADDREVAELAIVENLQRKDLNALEKAASFQQYLEKYDCTQEELAQRLKIDRSTVANLIRLLELPVEVQDAVRRGSISQGHARALLPLGDEQEQIAFAHRVQAEGLSVRATESLVQEIIHQADAEPLAVIGADGQVSRPVTKRSDQLAALEQELRSALGAKVEVKHSRSGRGKIMIHFATGEEFERLMTFLCPARQQRGQAG